MLPTADASLTGLPIAPIPPVAVPVPAPRVDADGPTPFGRLVQITRDNDRLFAEMGALAVRLRRARAYLMEPGCNALFGRACLDRAKRRYALALLNLRANRIEALQILGDDRAEEHRPAQ